MCHPSPTALLQGFSCHWKHKGGSCLDIRIAIIDDLKQDYTHLESLLRSWEKNTYHKLVIKHFSEPFNVLDANESRKFDFDLLFLDIMMPSMNGLDLIKELQKNSPSILFILTSSNKSYAETGYSVYAFDFLSKPVSAERLSSAMERVTYRLSAYKSDGLVYSAGRQTSKIPYSDVLFFQSNGNYADVYMVTGGKTLIRATLKSIANDCPDYFVKANRNTLVNMMHVSSFDHEKLRFNRSDLTVPITKVAYDDVRKAFLRLN